MIRKRQYAVRRLDGRLIRTATSEDEARSVAWDMTMAGAGADDLTSTAIVEREDAAPIPLIVDGQQDADALLDALEYVLRLDPETCEREFMDELREKVDRRYPGDGV